MIQYLLNALGFPHGGSCPYICKQNARTVIYIKRKNTDHRTHKVESKTYKTINQK